MRKNNCGNPVAFIVVDYMFMQNYTTNRLIIGARFYFSNSPIPGDARVGDFQPNFITNSAPGP
jgi:hypothetical protein